MRHVLRPHSAALNQPKILHNLVAMDVVNRGTHDVRRRRRRRRRAHEAASQTARCQRCRWCAGGAASEVAGEHAAVRLQKNDVGERQLGEG